MSAVPSALAGRRPVISIVVPLKIRDVSADVDALVDRFTVSALRLIQAAGADIRLVDVSGPSLPDVDSVLESDGLVLLGGGDLDPALYDHAGPVPNLYGVDRGADEYTIELVRAARSRRTPLLGICRGAQVVNFACGGTVVPDIVDFSSHRGAPPGPTFLDEKVTLIPGSWLAGVYATTHLVVRNGHHQAVGQVADGFRVAAFADDGLVEAIESVTEWACFGVQWHPEDTDGQLPDAEMLFADFVARLAPQDADSASAWECEPPHFL